MEDKKAICRAALDLRGAHVNDWDAGFIHGVLHGSNGVSENFYQRIQQKLLAQKIEEQE